MADSLAGVQQTFSSWDSCMSKAYCKWPVIVGIIIGSLIVLSVLFCVARCLCFGAECCACCCSCMGCCCPSRRSKGRGGSGGYQQPPPAPMPYHQQYPQYNSPQPPVYGQYRGPQTATFDAPSKPATTNARFNEDALPNMPSWDTAATRHVEEHVEEEPVEMDHLKQGQMQQQQQHLLAGRVEHNGQPYQQPTSPQPYVSARDDRGYFPTSYNGQGHTPRSPMSPAQSSQYNPYDSYQQHTYAGDVGNMSAQPYHDYDNHQQYAPTLSPVSTMYAPSSTAPPSYRTHAPDPVSPPLSNYNTIPNRRPVQGSWRDV